MFCQRRMKERQRARGTATRRGVATCGEISAPRRSHGLYRWRRRGRRLGAGWHRKKDSPPSLCLLPCLWDLQEGIVAPNLTLWRHSRRRKEGTMALYHMKMPQAPLQSARRYMGELTREPRQPAGFAKHYIASANSSRGMSEHGIDLRLKARAAAHAKAWIILASTRPSRASPIVNRIQ